MPDYDVARDYQPSYPFDVIDGISMIERLRALIINAQSRKEVIQAFATMRLATIQNGIPDSGSDARMSQIQEALACRAAMEEVRDSFVSSAMAAQLIIDALTEEVLKLANQAVGD